MPRVSTTAIIIGFSLGLLLGAPSAPAFAGPPAEQLASQIDRVLAVLDDPAFKGKKRELVAADYVYAWKRGVFRWR